MPHAPHIHRWYCTASWARRRAHQLRVEPLCRLCLKVGRVTPATVADHVTPHRGDYTAFRLGQLRSLCADCHNKLDANNAPVREDGTPSDPNHPWNASSKGDCRI
jgi:5-methylcytosine-specific restriction endonuclease McrA